MGQILDPGADQVVGAGSQNCPECRVGLQDHPVHADQADADGGTVERAPEPSFGFHQGRVGALFGAEHPPEQLDGEHQSHQGQDGEGLHQWLRNQRGHDAGGDPNLAEADEHDAEDDRRLGRRRAH